MEALRALPEYRSAAEAALADPPQFQVLPATDYLRPLRPQHWLKDLLTFVPLFAAHLLLQPLAVERTLAVFLAFCCCASSGYLFNDLCDLSADRRHPRKRLRPFAPGRPPLAILGFAKKGRHLRADHPQLCCDAQRRASPSVETAIVRRFDLT